MKKSVLFLVASLILLVSTNALAAWTNTATVSESNGKVIVTITMNSDAGTTSFDLKSILSGWQWGKVDGKLIYTVITNPGAAAPDAVYTVTMTNSLGHVATLTDRSVTVTEGEMGNTITNTGGFMSIYESLTIASSTLGNGHQTVIILELY